MQIRFVCRNKYVQIVKQIFAIVKYLLEGSGRSAITRARTRLEVRTAVGGGLLGGAGHRIFYSGNAQELIQNEYPYLKWRSLNWWV